MRAKTLDSQSFLQPSLLPVSQATPPVTIPGSKFTPNGSNFSISWQSPPVTFTGIPVSTEAWQGHWESRLWGQSTTTVSPGLHVVEGGLWLLPPPHGRRYYRCRPSHLFPEARASFFFKTALFFILSVWVFCLLVCLCATYVPGAYKGQKRESDSWNCSYSCNLSCGYSEPNLGSLKPPR